MTAEYQRLPRRTHIPTASCESNIDKLRSIDLGNVGEVNTYSVRTEELVTQTQPVTHQLAILRLLTEQSIILMHIQSDQR